jgi:hypothetical protein
MEWYDTGCGRKARRGTMVGEIERGGRIASRGRRRRTGRPPGRLRALMLILLIGASSTGVLIAVFWRILSTLRA